MRAYVDSTVLIALGRAGELGLLHHAPGDPVVLPATMDEVETEPEATNLDRFVDQHDADVEMPADATLSRATDVLGQETVDGDATIVAAVLDHVASDEQVLVLTDDARIRDVASGLGASVSGTLGVLVYAVEEGLEVEQAKRLLGRIDDDGFHLTGTLRTRAERMIDEAGLERD